MSPHESILHLPTLLPQIAERVTISVEPYTLSFRRPAKTSRGEYETKRVYYLRLQSLEQAAHVGYGECAPMPQLSCDDLPDYQVVLEQLAGQLAQAPDQFDVASLRPYPSIAFGLATAINSFLAACRSSEGETEPPFCDTPFTRGEMGIPINGLIWMGNKDYMYEQIQAKLAQGFRCLKLKIGGIDFAEELELLRYVRQHFSPEEMELRVDANGAFAPEVALERLKQLSDFHLHSIEQPIPASNQWDNLAKLTAASPLPVALDEELIGIHTRERKAQLLDEGKPHYIILKPSLHSGVDEWIELAEERDIGWWATSALESNVGLSAIAQWVSQYPIVRPQGLGTGALYLNNKPSTLRLVGDQMFFREIRD